MRTRLIAMTCRYLFLRKVLHTSRSLLARCHRRHETSWSRRVRGARAATTTTAVAGRVPVVGRVPSGPLGGRTGTAGPADCDSTFMCELLERNEPKKNHQSACPCAQPFSARCPLGPPSCPGQAPQLCANRLTPLSTLWPPRARRVTPQRARRSRLRARTRLAQQLSCPKSISILL